MKVEKFNIKGETSQEYQERKNENQLAKRNIVEGEANSIQ